MGYYTNYTVTAFAQDYTRAEEAMKALETASGYTGWYGDPAERTLNEVKWYDWEKDLSRVSREFKDVIFKVRGVGEEDDDLWESWTHDGFTEKVGAIIRFPEPAWVGEARMEANHAHKAKLLEQEEADKAKRRDLYEELKKEFEGV